MVPKLLVYREKSAQRLDHLLVQHSATVDEGFRKFVAAALGDAAVAPGVRALLETARQVLRQRRTELWSAVQALQDRRAFEQGRRGDVDEAAAALYDKVSMLRAHLRTNYGFRRGSALAGLHGDTPREPMKLLHEADRMVSYFSKGDLVLPPVKMQVSDPETWVRMIAPETKTLRDAYLKYLQAKQETEGALVLKNKAVETFDDALFGVAGLTEFLGHLAGYHALTRWARPSRRMKGLLHEAAKHRRRKRRQPADGAG